MQLDTWVNVPMAYHVVMSIHLINASVYRGKGKFDKQTNVVLKGGKISGLVKGKAPKGAKGISFTKLHESYLDWTKGPITKVGKRPQPEQTGDVVIDCSGLRIYPGMIEPHCHITCFEDGAGAVGSQGNDTSDPNTAHLDIKDSMWPEDLAVPRGTGCGDNNRRSLPRQCQSHRWHDRRCQDVRPDSR